MVITNKKRTCEIVNFALPADHRVKLVDSKMKDKYLELVREFKNSLEQESDGDTDCEWCAWYSHQRIDKGTRGHGNKRTSGNHPKYYVTSNGQNTEKSPRDLTSLAVTQTPVKNHEENSQGKREKLRQMDRMLRKFITGHKSYT